MASDTTLRPGEIKDILLREIEAADLHELDVDEVGTVLEVKDGIARIYGLGKAMAGEMLEFTSSETGNKITGQVTLSEPAQLSPQAKLDISLVDVSAVPTDANGDSTAAAPNAPARAEILVTTSVESGGRYLARTADVYSVEQRDTALYQPRTQPAPSVKTWRVVTP